VGDLVHLKKLKPKNEEFQYLFTVIDWGSKYGFCFLIANKTGAFVTDKLSLMFKYGHKPDVFKFDNGKEFRCWDV
jgi:IS30 family transposase